MSNTQAIEANVSQSSKVSTKLHSLNADLSFQSGDRPQASKTRDRGPAGGLKIPHGPVKKIDLVYLVTVNQCQDGNCLVGALVPLRQTANKSSTYAAIMQLQSDAESCRPRMHARAGRAAAA